MSRLLCIAGALVTVVQLAGMMSPDDGMERRT